MNYRKLEVENTKSYYNLVNEIKDEEIYLFHSLRFSEESTKEYVNSHNTKGLPIIGAFSDSELIGWIDYNIGGFPEIEHTATIGMGIKKEYRKKGIGFKLMTMCIENAKSHGVEILELEVFESNTAGFNLYKKCGFKETGRLIKKRKYKGNYEDLICMYLEL
ncbi:MAG: N-acetyltransferase family protein [Vulcanibacillus sp.]